MLRNQKLNLIAGVVGVLLILWALYMIFFHEGRKPPEPEPPIRPAYTLLLETPAGAVTRSFPGRVQSGSRVELAFRVGGQLVELPAQGAQEVNRGQVLARLDPRDFETALARVQSARTEAEAKLKAMKAGARTEEIRRLEEEVNAAEASFQVADEQLRRYDVLIVKGAVSQLEHDRSKRNREMTRAKLEAAREALKQGRAGARAEDIEAQEAVIQGLVAQEKEAQDALEDATLRAPFAGQVARVLVDNHEIIKADQPILSLQDTANLEVVIQLPEALAAGIRREDVSRITGTFDFAPGREFELTVVEAETEADPRTQTYAVTLGLPAPEGVKVLPGMTAEVTLKLRQETESDSPQWAVPADAVFSDEQGATFVWKVDEQALTVHRSPVTTVGLRGDAVLVTEGVQAGDRIVTAGVHSLREGMQIRLLNRGQ